MSSNPEQEVLLEEIRDLLIEIRDTLQGKNQPKDEQPILVDPSRGTCPACQSANVDLGKIEGVHVAYHCRDCETVWVNDEQAIRG